MAVFFDGRVGLSNFKASTFADIACEEATDFTTDVGISDFDTRIAAGVVFFSIVAWGGVAATYFISDVGISDFDTVDVVSFPLL